MVRCFAHARALGSSAKTRGALGFSVAEEQVMSNFVVGPLVQADGLALRAQPGEGLRTARGGSHVYA